jgi:hypothetical protein
MAGIRKGEVINQQRFGSFTELLSEEGQSHSPAWWKCNQCNHIETNIHGEPFWCAFCQPNPFTANWPAYTPRGVNLNQSDNKYKEESMPGLEKEEIITYLEGAKIMLGTAENKWDLVKPILQQAGKTVGYKPAFRCLVMDMKPEDSCKVG